MSGGVEAVKAVFEIIDRIQDAVEKKALIEYINRILKELDRKEVVNKKLMDIIKTHNLKGEVK